MKSPKMPEMPEIVKTRMPSTNDEDLEQAAQRRKTAALQRQNQLSNMLSDNLRDKEKLGAKSESKKARPTVVSQNKSSGTKLGA